MPLTITEYDAFLLPQPGGKRLPRWKRTILRLHDGNIFLPAALVGSGNENAIFFAASWSAGSLLFREKHLYVSLTWAEEEYTDEQHTAFWAMLRECVARTLAEGPGGGGRERLTCRVHAGVIRGEVEEQVTGT